MTTMVMLIAVTGQTVASDVNKIKHASAFGGTLIFQARDEPSCRDWHMGR